MTLRQAAWFLAAYVAVVAAAVTFDLAVLCQGDLKYDQGCGGFGIYIPLWLMFLAPLAIAGIILEARRKSGAPSTARLLAYLGAILVVAGVGFAVIDKFPVLLATEAVIIALAWLIRSKTTRHA